MSVAAAERGRSAAVPAEVLRQVRRIDVEIALEGVYRFELVPFLVFDVNLGRDRLNVLEVKIYPFSELRLRAYSGACRSRVR